jgi:hypothetical protein
VTTTLVVPNPEHPAKFSEEILQLLTRLVDEETRRVGRRLRVVDAMGGVGRVHELDADTVHGDLQIRWAACRRPSVQADAAACPFRAGSFDVWVSSPDYGNRMNDHYRNRDLHKPCEGRGCRGCKQSGLSPRKNYYVANGGPLHERNGARYHWGPRWKAIREAAYAEIPRLLAPGGLCLLNVSDFVRDRKVVDAVDWHRGALLRAGLEADVMYAVPTKRMRRGENYDARVPFEHVIAMRNPA